MYNINPEIIFVTGTPGRVGNELLRQFSQDNRTKCSKILAPNQKELDLLDEEAVGEFFKLHHPTVVINLAANTKVKETDMTKMEVNTQGVRNLITASKESGSEPPFFIQISTNMVHDKRWTEPHLPVMPPPEVNPAEYTPYALSKLEAEWIVAGSGLVYAIVRLAQIVSSEISIGGDYFSRWANTPPEKMPGLFIDQKVSITHILRACQALIELMFRRPGRNESNERIWHFTSNDQSTPALMVPKLFEMIGRPTDNLKTQPLPPEPELEKLFPRNSALDTKHLAERGLRTDMGTIDEIMADVVSGWKSQGLVPWTADKKYIIT